MLNFIQETNHLAFKSTHQTEIKRMNEADEWSQECLEYLFDNNIWLPVIVR